MKIHKVVMVLALPLFAVGAFAQTAATEVSRNANQQNRIEQGIKSGELTHHEAAKLERGQAQTSRYEARAAADGKLSPHEQHRIQHKRDQQSRKIHHEKHDQNVKS